MIFFPRYPSTASSFLLHKLRIYPANRFFISESTKRFVSTLFFSPLFMIFQYFSLGIYFPILCDFYLKQKKKTKKNLKEDKNAQRKGNFCSSFFFPLCVFISFLFHIKFSSDDFIWFRMIFPTFYFSCNQRNRIAERKIEISLRFFFHLFFQLHFMTMENMEKIYIKHESDPFRYPCAQEFFFGLFCLPRKSYRVVTDTVDSFITSISCESW